MTRIGSLFSGYGGLEQGVQSVLGGSVAWHSEIDPGACKILAHRYPDVPNLGDITAIDWAAVEPVDVLTGGSPCQDLSAAGKRLGMTEGTRSNLWVAMREAIAQLRPPLVVWENVRGALSAKASSDMELREGRLGDGDDGPVLRALGRVLGDLADLGYDASWQRAYARPMWAHLTEGSASSSLPGLLPTPTTTREGAQGPDDPDEWDAWKRERMARGIPTGQGQLGTAVRNTLLRTPTAQLAVNGGSQHPDKRKAGGGTGRRWRTRSSTCCRRRQRWIGSAQGTARPTAGRRRRRWRPGRRSRTGCGCRRGGLGHLRPRRPPLGASPRPTCALAHAARQERAAPPGPGLRRVAHGPARWLGDRRPRPVPQRPAQDPREWRGPPAGSRSSAPPLA